MYYKLHFGLWDVLPILILPVFSMIFLSPSLIHLAFIYLVIGVFVSLIYIKVKDKPSYGKCLYRREHDLNVNGFIRIVTIQLTLLIAYTILFTLVTLNMLFWHFIIINTLVIILFIKKNITISVYQEGLLYRGVFLNKANFEQAYIVKNYDDQYECYLTVYKSKMILDKKEIDYVSSWVK